MLRDVFCARLMTQDSLLMFLLRRQANGSELRGLMTDVVKRRSAVAKSPFEECKTRH